MLTELPEFVDEMVGGENTLLLDVVLDRHPAIRLDASTEGVGSR